MNTTCGQLWLDQQKQYNCLLLGDNIQFVFHCRKHKFLIAKIISVYYHTDNNLTVRLYNLADYIVFESKYTTIKI